VTVVGEAELAREAGEVRLPVGDALDRGTDAQAEAVRRDARIGLAALAAASTAKALRATAHRGWEQAPLPVDYVDTLDRLIAFGERGDAVEYFMITAVGMPAEMVAGMRGQPFWPAMEAVAHTLPYDGRLMAGVMSGKPIPPDRWSSVSASTLVLSGGDSPPYQHAAVEALADILPSAKRQTLAGQTHEVAPDVLAPALAGFFAAPGEGR
jgi:hypothetical protein